MRRTAATLLTFLTLGSLAACNGSTPVSPSAPIAGAMINGSLVSPGGGGSTNGSALSSPGPAIVIPTGLTVSIPGTNVNAPIDPSGGFVLRDVPAGTTRLQFSGPGVSATVTISSVATGQVLTITVSLTGTSASIETERRSGSGGEELEGRIESLPPTTAALAFVAAGRTVTTDANTTFFLQGAPASFTALALGQRVHVKGRTSGTALLAAIVDIQNTNADLPVNLNGVISGFSGPVTAFTFVVNGQTVKGDALTEFFGNSAFSDLADGRQVEVKGAQRDGFVYAVRLHVSDGGEGGTEIEFTGAIDSRTGTPPALTLSIAGKTVKTGAATDVRRRGDVQDPSVLRTGMTVDVSGMLQPDGTILAKKIQIEQDASGGQFEMTGVLAGRVGTCPAITFSVSGYSIATTGTTVFDPGCSAMTNGTTVKVEGIVQPDGSVSATKVQKK
jgi:hypothetical protein